MPRPLLRAVAAAACAVSLSACALSTPTPSTPPTTTSAANGGGTPTGGGIVVELPGFTVNAPAGYEDKTAENQDLFTDPDTRLAAYLKDAEGTSIIVSTVGASRPDLATSVKDYQEGLRAAGVMQVLSQRPAKVGGQDGVVLRLRDKEQDTESSEFLTVRPDYVLSIAGPNSSDEADEAVSYTASHIVFK